MSKATDIVTRLRKWHADNSDALEAADVIESLRADKIALLRDAKRWRWVRSCYDSPPIIDNSIDAAMSGTASK